jgi:hypothetical protein
MKNEKNWTYFCTQRCNIIPSENFQKTLTVPLQGFAKSKTYIKLFLLLFA